MSESVIISDHQKLYAGQCGYVEGGSRGEWILRISERMLSYDRLGPVLSVLRHIHLGKRGRQRCDGHMTGQADTVNNLCMEVPRLIAELV